ncbi:MAG: DUF2079 domain-containing protein [Bacteroidota bacterium]|nr:DUF2079 domain-containing protein [Bacteroidota bacterium]
MFEHKWLIILLLAFGTVFSLISIFNHLNFRTGSGMMGTYLHAMHDYLNFSLPEMDKLGGGSYLLLAKEFDLYLILLSPLSYLMGSYTLLIIQLLAILFGAAGVYRYLRLVSAYPWTPLLGSLHFLLFFGIYAALYNEYNSMVVAIMFIPWFFHSFKMENYNLSFLFLVLMILARETMGLILAFIFLGMIFDYFRDKKATARLVVFALISYLYFLLVSGLIMPSLEQLPGQAPFEYSFLGENMMDAFRFILYHPIASINFLMVNHTGNPAFDDIKKEFIIFFLLSGGILLIMRFRYLVMMIAMIFIMLLHDSPENWSVFSFFAALFAPILSIGLFDFFDRVGNPRHRIFLIIVTLLFTAGVSARMIIKTRYPGERKKIAFYTQEHYNRSILPDSVCDYMEKIPPEAVASSQSDFIFRSSLHKKSNQDKNR